MTKPFDKLYVDLEKALEQMERNHQDAEKYLYGIGQIRQTIDTLRIQGTKFIRNDLTEKEFFRHIWPIFHAKLFLYIRLYKIELRRGLLPADQWAAVLGEEEHQVAAFFQAHRVFWTYYKAGAPVIDHQFTRAYSKGRLFEIMALVIDQEGATLASYRAACCLAMEAYGKWLQEEQMLLSAGTASAADLGYSWAASDADLAELLFGLQAVGALQYKGQAADVSRLQKWARLSVGREVANIYDRGRVLRNRKKEKLVFTNKIAAALQKKWNEAEGKFD